MISFLSFSAEGDLDSFVLIKTHYKSSHIITNSLFTAETRTNAIQKLYNAAGRPPITVIYENVQNNENGNDLNHDIPKPSELYLCTPILSESRKRMKSNIDVEIETRLVSLFVFILYYFFRFHEFFILFIIYFLL